nr:hypothetical protein [Tanacetum cinerariifolium]
DARVTPANHLEFEKCDMRKKFEDLLNKKEVSLDVEIFREILQFCPKIPGQKFEDLLLEHDILYFIRDLGTLETSSALLIHEDTQVYGTGTIPGVLDVPKYDSKSDKESWGDSGDEDNNDDEGDQTEHEKEDVDERVHTHLDYELIDDEKIHDEENIDDEERMDEEEEDWDTKEMYKDVNVNLRNEDTEMTNAVQGGPYQQNVSRMSAFAKEEEDAHVTRTSVLDTQKVDEPVQTSSVSSDFTSKLLNLENISPADNEIASLMET